MSGWLPIAGNIMVKDELSFFKFFEIVVSEY